MFLAFLLRFVTGPHMTDDSFQRIGRALKDAKMKKSINKL